MIKDTSGNWSHLPWLTHEPISSPPCQWTVLAHTALQPNIIPVMPVAQLPAQCPTPVLIASAVWLQTWQSLPQQLPGSHDTLPIPFSQRASTHQGYWCMGGRQDLRGNNASSCISGLPKARENRGKARRQQGQQRYSQTAWKAVLEMLLQLRDTWFNKKK